MRECEEECRDMFTRDLVIESNLYALSLRLKFLCFFFIYYNNWFYVKVVHFPNKYNDFFPNMFCYDIVILAVLTAYLCSFIYFFNPCLSHGCILNHNL